MAIAFGSATAGVSGTNSTSALSLTIAAGETVVAAAIIASTSVTVTSVTDNGTGGSNSYRQFSSDTFGSEKLVVLVCDAAVHAATSVTILFSGSVRNVWSVSRWTGVASIKDASSTQNTNTGTSWTDSITTSAANSFAVAIIGTTANGSAQTLAVTTGTSRSNRQAAAATDGLAIASNTTASSGATLTVAGTYTSSATWQERIVELSTDVAVAATDTFSFSESATRTIAVSRTATDTRSFSDSTTRSLALTRTATDTQSFSDSVGQNVALSRFATDTLSFSDSVGRTTGAFRTATDTFTFSDSAVLPVPIAVSGVLQDAHGIPLPHGTVTFSLANLAGAIPVVHANVTAILAQTQITYIANASGAVSGLLWANDVILPQGTWWEVTVTDQTGRYQRTCAISTLSTQSVDLTNLNCLQGL